MVDRRTLKRIANHFESKAESPPLIIDFLQPWVVPILTAVVFVLLALLIYVVTIRRDRVCADNVKSGAG